MQDEPREVTAPCPCCGQPFVLAMGRLGAGHAVDVVAWACDCALTEDEYADLCDAAVAAAEAERDEPPGAAAAGVSRGGGQGPGATDRRGASGGAERPPGVDPPSWLLALGCAAVALLLAGTLPGGERGGRLVDLAYLVCPGLLGVFATLLAFRYLRRRD